MSAEQHMAGAMRRLAEQFQPSWSIPPDLQWYALPDRELANLFRLGIEGLRAERAVMAERLEAIEDGTYSARGDWGNWQGLDSYYNAKGSKTTRFSLDRCEACHMLWWIDMAIQVHTA